MVLVGGLRTAALAFFALAACVKADFSVFYGSLDGYGVSGYYWFFMNTVPAACDDFENVTSYEYDGSGESECASNKVCGTTDDNGDWTRVGWNDVKNDNSAQMTSCNLGDGTAIQKNDNGGYDLMDASGYVHGSCQYLGKEDGSGQQVDCPSSYVDFNGYQVFSCQSDCYAINSN